MVVAYQPRKAVWLSYRKELIKAAPEQVRPMNEEEELGFTMVPQELRDQRDAIQNGAADGYFDLMQEERPLVDSDDEDLPHFYQKGRNQDYPTSLQNRGFQVKMILTEVNEKYREKERKNKESTGYRDDAGKGQKNRVYHDNAGKDKENREYHAPLARGSGRTQRNARLSSMAVPRPRRRAATTAAQTQGQRQRNRQWPQQGWRLRHHHGRDWRASCVPQVAWTGWTATSRERVTARLHHRERSRHRSKRCRPT